MDTRSVVERHLRALLAGDVEAVIDGFHDDAVLVAPDGVLRGRRELTEGFERLVDGLFAPGTFTFTLDTFTVAGDAALVTWHGDCTGTRVAFASESFVVRDGRIAAQTSTAVFEEH